MEKMAPVPAPPKAPGLVGNIQKKVSGFNLEKWTEDIAGSSAHLLRAAMAFGAGFAVGFLFKKYFKTALIALITAVILIKFLEYNEILSIQWPMLKQAVGVETKADFQHIITGLVAWGKAHIVMCIAAVGGCVIGYRLG